MPIIWLKISLQAAGIELGGRFIHIRYFMVRRDDRYLGCLEVSQDVTAIRALEGQQRLLDWK